MVRGVVMLEWDDLSWLNFLGGSGPEMPLRVEAAGSCDPVVDFS